MSAPEGKAVVRWAWPEPPLISQEATFLCQPVEESLDGLQVGDVEAYGELAIRLADHWSFCAASKSFLPVSPAC